MWKSESSLSVKHNRKKITFYSDILPKSHVNEIDYEFRGVGLSYQDRKTVQAIGTVFESWQPWQRRIFYAGLLNRFNKKQLVSLSIAVESVFHRDFATKLKDAYPMRKIKSRELINLNDYSTYLPSDLSLAKLIPMTGSGSKFVEQMTRSTRGFVNKNPSSKNTAPLFTPPVIKFPVVSRPEKPISMDDDSSNSSSSAKGNSVALQQSAREIFDALPSDVNIESTSLLNETNLLDSHMSIPSIWTVGQSNSHVGSEFEDEFTRLSIHTDDFFPPNFRETFLGECVTTSSMSGLQQFMERFDFERNKTPFPLANQLYKSKKLWSPQHPTVMTNVFRLKELFQQQLDHIWKLISMWEEHKRVRLLLHLLSFSTVSEVKFAADCIKSRLRDSVAKKKLEEKTVLPDRVWQAIANKLNSLKLPDIGSSSSQINLLDSADMWQRKLEEIGGKIGIDNFTALIEQNCDETGVKDWKEAFYEIQTRMRLEPEKFTGVKNLEDIQQALRDATPHEDLFWGAFSNEELDVPEPPLVEPAYGRDRKERRAGRAAVKKKRFTDIREEISNLQTDSNEALRGVTSEELDWRKEQAREDLLLERPETIRIAPGKERDDKKRSGEELPSATSSKELEKKKKPVPVRSTRKCDVDLFETLLNDEELEEHCMTPGYFGVDFHIPGGLPKSWLADNVIVPVRSVVALEGHRGPIWCVLAQGHRIFSGGMDRKIRLWTLNGECYGKMEDCLKGGVLDMAIGADENCRTLYAASWDLSISIFDSLTYKRLGMMTGHDDTVTGVAIGAHYIVSCSHDCTIKIWDIKTHACIRTLKHHHKPILCLVFSEQNIITGASDKLVMISHAQTGKLLKTLKGHQNEVTAVQCRHNLVCSGDADGHLFFWSLDGDEDPVDTLHAHKSQINAIEFHEKRFFTASNDRTVKEWDLMSMMCVRILQGHTRAVTDVKYTYSYLVTCSRDGTVRIWWWDDDDDDDEHEYEEEEEDEDEDIEQEILVLSS